MDLNALFYHLIDRPPEGKTKRFLLLPLTLLSLLYGWIVGARLFLYRKRVFRTRSLPCRVVSVGNLTLGGTGKTPFSCLIAEILRGHGVRTAILSRGYRGKFEGPFGVVSDGARLLMSPEQAGDEPYLMADKLIGVPVIVGRDRWLSGQHAVQKFKSEVVILDDGFQHLSLKRDLDLLLVDSSTLFGNGYLFPRGMLREPVSQMRRADAFILTKADQFSNINNFKSLLRKKEDSPVFQAAYEPGALRGLGMEFSLPARRLKGMRVLAFCGIARPDSFLKSLLSLEAEIAGFETFPDHHSYRENEWGRLSQRAMELKAEAFVTTEKDLVRMGNLPPGSIPLWALSIRHVFQEGDEGRFAEFLFSRLGLAG